MYPNALEIIDIERDYNPGIVLSTNFDVLKNLLIQPNDNPDGLINSLNVILIKIPPYAVKFNINRNIGFGQIRKITLLYIHAEALDVYLKLFKKGEIAPKYICTIQTGGFEKPNGVLNRFLSDLKSNPLIWVRGVWKDTKYHLNVLDASIIFANDNLYGQFYQTYNNWNSRLDDNIFPQDFGFENIYFDESMVRAFTFKKNI